MGPIARIIQAAMRQPLALRQDKLAEIAAMLAARAVRGEGDAAAAAFWAAVDKAERQAADQRIAQGRTQGVAVIPIRGTLAHHAGGMREASGGASYESVVSQLDAALAAPEAGAVLLDIDSPGGVVNGLPEAAARIRSARGGDKPVWAIANSGMASAAYWLGAQADRLIATPSAEVGSVGVWAGHEDISAALEMEGRKVTLVQAGARKTDGNPFQPLSEAALADMQAKVDAFEAMFVEDLARGRGMSADAVRKGFGEGAMFLADEAKARGMVDDVMTFEDALSALSAEIARPAAGRTASRRRRLATL